MEQNIVTGYLSTVSNGKQDIVSFNVSYARFAVAQLLIVSLMQTTALWGVAAALGVDPPAPEAGASTGDIELNTSPTSLLAELLRQERVARHP